MKLQAALTPHWPKWGDGDKCLNKQSGGYLLVARL